MGERVLVVGLGNGVMYFALFIKLAEFQASRSEFTSGRNVGGSFRTNQSKYI